MGSDFAQVFEGRLAALGRVNELVSTGGASLRCLLEQELSAAAGDVSRYGLEGPSVILHPDCAFGLSLLLHELAANAREHGSLSAPRGRVDVGWHLEDGDLVLSWSESGGPPARRPLSPGFGNLLVAYTAVKLKGHADCRYERSGLVCNLRVSLLASWPRRGGAIRLGRGDALAPSVRAM